jgi:hypothetical protein
MYRLWISSRKVPTASQGIDLLLESSNTLIGPPTLQAHRTIPAVRSIRPTTTPLFATSYELVRTPATRPICVRRVPIRFAPLRYVSRGLAPHRTYPTRCPLASGAFGYLSYATKTCAEDTRHCITKERTYFRYSAALS